MREHPIIFSGESVRAILDSRKTQSRRGMRLQPWEGWGTPLVGVYNPTVVDRRGDEGPGPDTFGAFTEDGEWAVRCPYGQPGDRLWVRETFAVHGCAEPRVYAPGEGHPWGSPIYRASHGGMEPKCEGFTGWRSPLHMPRWASRLTLAITEVRVERVQEISEDDARAEGVEATWYDPENSDTCAGSAVVLADSCRDFFSAAWDALNAKRGYPWDSNPWVWVLTFKRVEA